MAGRDVSIAKTTRSTSDRELKLTPQQLACLSSPVRIQLYETLRIRGSASVVELANDMGKTVHALYYHIKALTKVDLLRIAEYRKSGKRDEAVYEPVSIRLLIDRDNNSSAYTESLIKTVRLTLRKAEREHQAARQSEIPSELFSLLRIQANLTDEDTRILRSKLKSLGNWIRKRDQRDGLEPNRPVAVTCIGVPLKRED